MEKKIGFIGAGKMAQAMIAGMVHSGIIPRENIMASSATKTTVDKVEAKYGISTSLHNVDVARYADILILAVKPDLHPSVINEIKMNMKQHVIIVTIAAGITLGNLEQLFGYQIKAVRTMPNTPSLVGEGMSVICGNHYICEHELAEVEVLFSCFGKTERLEEKVMDAVPSISGSSPAYVYMLIEAMADGGVRQGIPRDKAYRLAAQAVLGAAKMVLETELHPGELKDQVCTPGGATIEAVATLEKEYFRGTILAAMESCSKKVTTLT
ncbi:pyrroline-5-carboxylate reductase [Neobacillus sp. MM2021_6]|uniref:pyrroline-5-carboxylate reductase n=1 Tax=Bacillaceae TaxID=186817 RepID=UPI00140A22DB|nr:MULTISPECIES: pyrroline-5-carboxylate reductase [Bacillaceae]MBO0961582.1 pyrroline-5-carboxylate reductase [Neobacillus sp. MM2021_6]NHC19502.1 pyrroline-5-carboxylate reductase [Bacillus sp. MM2020_4]